MPELIKDQCVWFRGIRLVIQIGFFGGSVDGLASDSIHEFGRGNKACDVIIAHLAERIGISRRCEVEIRARMSPGPHMRTAASRPGDTNACGGWARGLFLICRIY